MSLDLRMSLMLFVTNTLMLWIGALIGDEAHHEAADVAEERTFDQHVQSAMWVARRSL